MIQIILVPQGAEYRAVCRGISKTANPPKALPIPVGTVPVIKRLRALQEEGCFSQPSGILVMGLCGSLNPRYSVGDLVLYQECISHPTPHTPHPLFCDRPLTSWLQQSLGNQVNPVKALTSDRVICLATEKRSLSSYADVVDMEGYAILEFFHPLDIPVAMLRVISDDCHHDIPDLSGAVDSEGMLQGGKLAIALLRQPIAAANLIRGSLKGLKVLQDVITTLSIK